MADQLAQRLQALSMPEPNSGCLLWCGWTDSKGYGRMKIGGRAFGAHRVAWEAARGPIPPDMEVCHRCDVRGCVNVEHLFLGAHQTNMADMKAKGRSPQGTRNGSAKLTLPQAVAILRDPRAQRAIASDLNISKTQVGYIKSGRSWAHLQRAR